MEEGGVKQELKDGMGKDRKRLSSEVRKQRRNAAD